MIDIESAIEQLKIKKSDMELCVGLIKSGNQFVPKQSTPLMEAINMSIQALQEKAKREKLQEHCSCIDTIRACCTCVSMHCNSCTRGKNKYVQGNYCSACGRKIGDT